MKGNGNTKKNKEQKSLFKRQHDRQHDRNEMKNCCNEVNERQRNTENIKKSEKSSEV